MKIKIRKCNIWLIVSIVFFILSITLIISNLYEAFVAGKHAKTTLQYMNFDERFKVKSKRDYFDQILQAEKLKKTSMPIIRIGEYDYIGKLEIKSIGIILPVIDRVDDHRLEIAPCRFSGSIYDQNLVLTGHNYYSHFGLIPNLNTGDKVKFIDALGNIFNYAVMDQEILNEDQVSECIENLNNSWDLTLFTCTLTGTQRHVIRCKLIKSIIIQS